MLQLETSMLWLLLEARDNKQHECTLYETLSRCLKILLHVESSSETNWRKTPQMRIITLMPS